MERIKFIKVIHSRWCSFSGRCSISESCFWAFRITLRKLNSNRQLLHSCKKLQNLISKDLGNFVKSSKAMTVWRAFLYYHWMFIWLSYLKRDSKVKHDEVVFKAAQKQKWKTKTKTKNQAFDENTGIAKSLVSQALTDISGCCND